MKVSSSTLMPWMLGIADFHPWTLSSNRFGPASTTMRRPARKKPPASSPRKHQLCALNVLQARRAESCLTIYGLSSTPTCGSQRSSTPTAHLRTTWDSSPDRRRQQRARGFRYGPKNGRYQSEPARCRPLDSLIRCHHSRFRQSAPQIMWPSSSPGLRPVFCKRPPGRW